MYLIQNGILCKQYQDHVKRVRQELKEASLEPFRREQLPIRHIYDPRTDKNEIARAMATERGISQGKACALTAMELSPTFQHEKTTMAIRRRPNLVIYHYRIDPQFGWCHARIQTWFPFYVHVCMNGREWLARRLDQAGIRYCRQKILALSTSPKGFTAGELAGEVRRLGGSPGNAYSTRQAAYDIRKLRRKQMVEKRPHSHRYRSVPDGLPAMAAAELLRDKVIRPLPAAQGRPRRGRPPKHRAPIDIRYAALQREMRGLFEEIGIAA